MKVIIVHNAAEPAGLAWISQLEKQLECGSTVMPAAGWKESFTSWWKKSEGRSSRISRLSAELSKYRLVVICFSTCSKGLPPEVRSFLKQYRTSIQDMALVILKSRPGDEGGAIEVTEKISGMRPVALLEVGDCRGKKFEPEESGEFIEKIKEFIKLRQ
jgi:hypothetical protein